MIKQKDVAKLEKDLNEFRSFTDYQPLTDIEYVKSSYKDFKRSIVF